MVHYSKPTPTKHVDIEWSRPLETDEPIPRTVEVVGPASFPGYVCDVKAKGAEPIRATYYLDGKLATDVSSWLPSIRNVRPVRTADETLQRMERLVRKMAEGSFGGTTHVITEAREIVALLPAPPVDPDLIEARRLVAEAFHQDGSASYALVMNGLRDNDESVGMALAGIARGRKLASGESQS